MVHKDRAGGYLTVSNRPLRDGALSLKAKGLFAVMASLPPEWQFSVRGLAAICKEGRDAVRSALLELERAGYLRRTPRRCEGRSAGWEYELFERPAVEAPPRAEIPRLREQVRALVEYDYLLPAVRDREQLDELVEVMVELLAARGETVKIGGEEYPAELVRERIYAFDGMTMQYVLERLLELRGEVRDMRSYLRTVLFAAPVTIGNYYAAAVRDLSAPCRAAGKYTP